MFDITGGLGVVLCPLLTPAPLPKGGDGDICALCVCVCVCLFGGPGVAVCLKRFKASSLVVKQKAVCYSSGGGVRGVLIHTNADVMHSHLCEQHCCVSGSNRTSGDPHSSGPIYG